MLSDRDALLAAIRANPEEDTPRLMFADWLDEHGEPERAEFIRLQCEIALLADEGGDSYAMYAFLRDRYPTGLAASDWTRIDPGVHRLVALHPGCQSKGVHRSVEFHPTARSPGMRIAGEDSGPVANAFRRLQQYDAIHPIIVGKEL